MSFTKQSVYGAIRVLLDEPTGDLVEDIKTIAGKHFIGDYDGIIRVPAKKRTEKTDAFVVALRVIRAVYRQYRNTGNITFGSLQADPVEEFSKQKEWPKEVWVADVTEYESGWGSRPDGHIICLEESDHRKLLKSDNGQHLCGDYHTYSTITSSFVKLPLKTDISKDFMEKLLTERAIWVSRGFDYVEKSQ